MLNPIPKIRRFKDNAAKNPDFSLKLNQRLAVFWVINFIVVIFLYFFFPAAWEKMSILYLALVSIYANFVGHTSAAEAAMGNKKQDEIEEKRVEDAEERDEKLVEKIDEVTPDK